MPDPDYIDINNISLMLGDITETKDGAGNVDVPDWLIAYILGGIDEVEKIDSYFGKYCFIAENEGGNFGALNKWADNYSEVQDFPRLAAARIERRLISAAELYPDDEYGSFYETLVKKAFSAEYAGALIEDIYWIKIRRDHEYNEEVYDFFILISIDRMFMRTIIGNMMAETLAEVTPARAQFTAIRRLQQNFYTGF